MRTCFVPLCDVKNKDLPNRTMFLAPREKSLFAQWVGVLPKVRTLRSNDRVCYLHFIPEKVVYTFDHLINGQIYKLKRDRPRLKADAVPFLEIPTEDELSCYKVKTRLISNSKVPKEIEEPIEHETLELLPAECEPNVEFHLHNQVDEEQQVKHCTHNTKECKVENFNGNLQQTDNEIEIQVALLEENINECDYNISCGFANQEQQSILDLFNLIFDNVYEILTPNSLWGIHRCPNRSIVYFTYMDMAKMQVTKMITIDTEGSVKLFASTHLIKVLHLIDDIDNLDNLSILLNQVDMWRICFAQDSSTDCEVIIEPSDDNCWYR